MPRVLRPIQHIDLTAGDPGAQGALARIAQALGTAAAEARVDGAEVGATQAPAPAPDEDGSVTAVGGVELVDIQAGSVDGVS